MEQPNRRFRHVGRVAVGLALGVAVAVVALFAGRPNPAMPLAVVSGSGPSVVAEVRNGSQRPGLARLVTRLLREEGVDVVYFGSLDSTEGLDSTVVLVRRGDADRGQRVARLLGRAKVMVATDTLLRVDVTILLGRDYRLPKGRFPL
ncbi:MAG: LytR C-terminal domain-containing protein [Gemmatimonadales bacterium]